MTGIDFIPIALVILYVALGFFTGVIRRLIGLVALYAAFVAATAADVYGFALLSGVIFAFETWYCTGSSSTVSP